MRRISVRSTNKWTANILTFLIIIMPITTIIISYLAIYVIPISRLGYYLLEYMTFWIILLVVIIYFFITEVYYYRIKIDSYIIDITSYQIISYLIKSRDFVDISHNMLSNYSFFNKPLSFKKILILRVNTGHGEIISKRFNLTLISKREIEAISVALDRIMLKNN